MLEPDGVGWKTGVSCLYCVGSWNIFEKKWGRCDVCFRFSRVPRLRERNQESHVKDLGKMG